MKLKITVIPFLIGSYLAGFFIGNYDFSLAATVILIILGLTKQVKWI